MFTKIKDMLIFRMKIPLISFLMPKMVIMFI